jgi:protein O-mannosyl-transferase
LPKQKPRDFLLAICVGLILLVVGWLGVWSNHFGSSFHFNDIPTIVDNPYLPHLSNIPRYFTDPRTFSATKETADYRPLLSTLFALDSYVGHGPKPFVFQSENFVWFGLQMLALVLLFRFIPGGNNFSAVFGASLYAVHPITADTVNYPLQRGVIMGSFGVTFGLMIWVFWPRWLPQKLPLKLKRVPELGFDEYLRNNFAMLDARYLKFIHAPLGLYLWPVVPLLLVEPATAMFAPLLIAYILVVDTDRKLRAAVPATVICVTWWIFQTGFVWKYGDFSRLPAVSYWITQPWVAMRYLFAFFAPVHLSADSDFVAFTDAWSPLALAGYAGVAALVALAWFLGRRAEWRVVAFGIWWFLIGLAPYAAVPRRVPEADWNMYFACAGLALAVSRAASIVVMRLYESEQLRVVALVGAPVLALGVLVACGWGTYRRNATWESEATLWEDVMKKSPQNGRAYMNFGLTRVAHEDNELALRYFAQAEQISPRDAVIAINLAGVYDTLSQPADAEAHYRRALADAPSYSPAYSWFARWLTGQGRLAEGLDMANKAMALDPYDLVGRRTVLEVLAQQHDWLGLKRVATEALVLYPDDPAMIGSLQVAQTGIDAVSTAKITAIREPTTDHYMELSVNYFNVRDYPNSIQAAREALKINPDLAGAYANIATAYHAMGDLDDTIAALQEEIRINPNLSSATQNLSVAMAEKAKRGH